MIEYIISKAAEAKASDIHIVCGIPVRFRVDGELKNMDDHIMTKEECEACAKEFGEEAFRITKEVGEADLAVTVCDRRLRVNVFMQQENFSLAIRMLNDKIPNLEDLNLPPVVSTFPEYRNGLVLVTGETGSGKSTTLAALLNRINLTANKHIITLEDPLEFIHNHKKSIVSQREIHTDTENYISALRAALRQTPDVILLGEMRDAETISTAMTAAETGHFVFSTLHTIGAANTIERIIDAFPSTNQQQVTVQLASVLQAVVSQRLLPTVDGQMAPAFEVMVLTPAIRNLIREGRTHQIDNIIFSSTNESMISMDASILNLYRKGVIDKRTALMNAVNPEIMSKKLM